MIERQTKCDRTPDRVNRSFKDVLLFTLGESGRAIVTLKWLLPWHYPG